MEELLTENPIGMFSSINFEELFTKLSYSVLSLGGKLLLAALIYFVGRWLIKRIIKLMLKGMKKREVSQSVFSFIRSLVAVSLNLVLIIVVIGILGIETSSFIALFASAGLAVGMALSGTLQNFAGGVMILFFKPYKVGDFIEAQGQSGTVKEIQIFNTILTTPDNKTIIVPNSGLSTGITINYSTTGARRVEWTFNISYKNSYDKAKAIIENLLLEDKRIKTDPAYLIALSSLGESSIGIVVRAWVDSGDFWSVFFDMNEKIRQSFEMENFTVPFKQMDVNLYNAQ